MGRPTYTRGRTAQRLKAWSLKPDCLGSHLSSAIYQLWNRGQVTQDSVPQLQLKIGEIKEHSSWGLWESRTVEVTWERLLLPFTEVLDEPERQKLSLLITAPNHLGIYVPHNILNAQWTSAIITIFYYQNTALESASLRLKFQFVHTIDLWF